MSGAALLVDFPRFSWQESVGRCQVVSLAIIAFKIFGGLNIVGRIQEDLVLHDLLNHNLKFVVGLQIHIRPGADSPQSDAFESKWPT